MTFLPLYPTKQNAHIPDVLTDSQWYRTWYPNTEIAGVSYSSDGRFLNSTIWLQPVLTDLFNETIKQELYRQSSENITLVGTVFLLSIDVHSSFDRGYDYGVAILWPHSSDFGIKQISEESSFKGTKVLSVENISNFYNGEVGRYVNLDFDLAIANYPKEYSIAFATSKLILVNQTQYSCSDLSHVFPVPPPDVIINASTNQLYLRPGEEKEVVLDVRSLSDVNTNLEFYNNYSNPSLRKKLQIPNDVNININPINLSLFPMGSALSTLTVNSTEDTLPQSITVPLEAVITLPDLKPPPGKENDPKFKALVLTNVTKQYYLTITLLPKLSFNEWLNDVATKWVSPFSVLWTFLAGIGAVIGPLVIRWYTRKKKEKSAGEG
jgi:hypothetical protein